jgi:hypothetical protein
MTTNEVVLEADRIIDRATKLLKERRSQARAALRTGGDTAAAVSVVTRLEHALEKLHRYRDAVEGEARRAMTNPSKTPRYRMTRD